MFHSCDISYILVNNVYPVSPYTLNFGQRLYLQAQIQMQGETLSNLTMTPDQACTKSPSPTVTGDGYRQAARTEKRMLSLYTCTEHIHE